MAVELKKVKYGPFEDCLELSNGIARLVITVGFGPRIIYYGLEGGKNAFCNFEEQMADFSTEEWKSYGGHRLWHAPEVYPRTYYCDCDPVEYKFEDGILILTCKPETTTGLQKNIAVFLDDDSSRVEIRHSITNTNCWSCEFSAWALSVMAAGTRAFIPQEDFVPHGHGEGQTLVPARPVVLWPFTRMNDHRLEWEDRYIGIKEDCTDKPVKIGVKNTKATVVADGPGGIFIKTHDYFPEDNYPDMGCNEEFFTIAGFLEIETLSPLVSVQPGEELEHFEFWRLEEGRLPDDPAEIAEAVQKYVEEEREYDMQFC